MILTHFDQLKSKLKRKNPSKATHDDLQTAFVFYRWYKTSYDGNKNMNLKGRYFMGGNLKLRWINNGRKMNNVG